MALRLSQGIYSEYLQRFREIHLTMDQLKTKSFEDVSEYISQRDVIHHAAHFLKMLNDVYSKGDPVGTDPKILLSLYMIVYFRDVVLNVNDDDMLDASKIVLDRLNMFLDSVCEDTFHRLMESLKRYYDMFVPWRQRDSESLIAFLAKTYWDLHYDTMQQIENEEDDQTKEFLEICLEDEKRSILQRVYEVGGENAIDFFNHLVPVVVHEEVYRTVETIVKQAYWDSLEDRLSGENPDYLSILPMLADVKDYIKQCVPHHEGIHQEVEDHIDLELLKQMIEQDVMDDTYVRGLAIYIMEMIRKLEAGAFDSETNQWIKETKKILAGDVNYATFFPKFFRKVFYNLECIVEASRNFRMYLSERDESEN